MAAWQMYKRDIDPTNWMRKNGEYRTYYNEQTTWWQPYRFPIENLEDLDAKKAYLWDDKDVPDFSALLITNDSVKSLDWYVLRGFCVQQQKKSEVDSKAPRLDCWFRINSIIVSEDDLEDLKEKLSEASLIDPNTVSVPSLHFSLFRSRIAAGNGHSRCARAGRVCNNRRRRPRLPAAVLH